MKIAVLAGTLVDTKMGNDILNKFGYSDTVKIAVSKNPIEQTLFQTSDMNYKENIIDSIFQKLIKERVEIIFVYCNSLSSSVDFDKFSNKYNIRVITPLHVYKNLAMKYQKVMVLSANAQGLSGIEKVMIEENPLLNIFGISFLDLVEKIEKGLAPLEVFKKMGIEKLIELCNFLKIDTLVLGCTHFPYIKKEIEENSSIEVIDPTESMINLISKKLGD